MEWVVLIVCAVLCTLNQENLDQAVKLNESSAKHQTQMQRSFSLCFKGGRFIKIKLNKNPNNIKHYNSNTKKPTKNPNPQKTIQKGNYILFHQQIAASLQYFSVQRFFYSSTHLSCLELSTFLPLHALLFLYKALCIFHIFLKLKYKSKQFCIASFVDVFTITSTLFPITILASWLESSSSGQISVLWHCTIATLFSSLCYSSWERLEGCASCHSSICFIMAIGKSVYYC